MAKIQFKTGGGGKAFRISKKFVLILHIFFPFSINMDKHGNDHVEKYFQNLHGKASKFLDFPQHSINCHRPVFKERFTQKWDRSSILVALRYIREQQGIELENSLKMIRSMNSLQ